MIKPVDAHVTRVRNELLAKTIRSLPCSMQSQILDLGCGDGQFLSMFPWSRTENLIAVDVDRVALRKTKGTLSDRDYVHVLCCDAHFLPFKNGSLDLIICQEVLEHVRDPKKALDEAFRILRNGSPMLVTVPFLWDSTELRNIANFLLKSSIDRLKNGRRAPLLKLIFRDIRVFSPRQFIPFKRRLSNLCLRLHNGSDASLHKQFFSPQTWRKIIERSQLKVEKTVGIAFWLCVLFLCRKI